MSKKAKITLLLSLTAFAASVYSLAAAAAYEPYGSETPRSAAVSRSDLRGMETAEQDTDTTQTPYRTKILRLYRGKIAVFEEDADTPIRVLPTDVAQLPPDAIERLDMGIYAYTAEQYRNYVEDFS